MQEQSWSEVFYASVTDVLSCDNEGNFDLSAWFDKAVTFTGARPHHCFIPMVSFHIDEYCIEYMRGLDAKRIKSIL